MPSAIRAFLAKEPLLVRAVLAGIIDAAIGYGLPVSPQAKGTIIAIVSALVLAWARGKVSPVRLKAPPPK